MSIEKIVSGGQTGADRAALDWAMANGVPCGGWCPRKRIAEDGTIPDTYPLVETNSHHYTQRTEWNVRDSDATVILTLGPELTDGSLTTLFKAAMHKKPCLHLSCEIVRGDHDHAASLLRQFIERHGVRVLNVAGPRASKEPEVASWVTLVLEATFRKSSPVVL